MSTYQELFARHRGPYCLAATAPPETPRGKNRTLWLRRVNGRPTWTALKEVPHVLLDADEVEDEARGFLADPKEDLISISVWSEKEHQFVTTFKKEDAAQRPAVPITAAEPVTFTETPGATKVDPLQDDAPLIAPSKVAAKKNAATPKRDARYVVADPEFNPGRPGTQAAKVWATFVALHAFTPQDAAKKLNYDPPKATVAYYASLFKCKGGLKKEAK